MPKRTNEFQKLVALIERSLAPHGAKVTESALVPGLANGDSREIDVLIESMLGPYHMKVAVEAKDEKRRMDITKFEAIVAKYLPTSGIKVNKVVVIARAGFTKQVVERARLEDIELLTLPEAIAFDWAAHGQQLVFMVQPHIAGFDFEPVPANVNVRDLISSSTFVCTCCGRNHGSPMDFARHALSDPDLIGEIRVAASKSGKLVCARLEWNLAKPVVLRNSQREYRVDRLTVHIHCICSRGGLTVKAYKHGDQTVHHFSTTTAGKIVQFVLPDGHSSERVVLKIESATTEPDPTTQTPIMPLADSPPMSNERESLLQTLKAQFASVDARLDIQSCVHNFQTGTDVAVDALVRIYVGGNGLLKAAIVFLDGTDDQQHDRICELVQVAKGAELDRMLIVCNQNIIPRSLELLHNSAVRVLAHGTNSADLLRALFPTLVLWIKELKSFNANVYSPDTLKIQEINDQATIVAQGKTFLIQNFYKIIVDRIMLASIDAFFDRQSPCSEYADCELKFDFRLPQGAEMKANSGEHVIIGRVAGTASVRGLVAVLDSMQIATHEGKQSLRFSPSERGIPLVVTASLPRTKQIHFEGIDLKAVTKKLEKCAPESIFVNLLGPVADSDLAAKASCHTSVAKIAKKDDGNINFSVEILPLSKLRIYPSLWR